MPEQQLTYPEALIQLRAAYEQEKILLTVRISTLEVTVGQQAIEIKKLLASIADEVVSNEAWEIIDEQVLEIKNLQMDVQKLQDEQMVLDIPRHVLTDDSLILQYTGVIEVEDNPFPDKKTPIPYPYTNPIRDLPDYSKVKRSKPNA